MIFLDTSVCIALLRGNIAKSDLIKASNEDRYAITAPTSFELNEGYYLYKYTKKAKNKSILVEMKRGIEKLERTTQNFPFTTESAKIASKINNQLIGKGKIIEVFDCLIAGVILSHGYKKILTYNIAHFENIEQLETIRLAR